MKTNLKCLNFNYWFLCAFYFLLWIDFGPVYGAAAPHLPSQRASSERAAYFVYYSSLPLLEVAFDPEMGGAQFFCCSFTRTAQYVSFSAPVTIKSLSAHGDKELDKKPVTAESKIDFMDINISISGIYYTFYKQTVLAIPGMAISDESIKFQRDFTAYGNYISVLDTVPIEIQKSLVSGLIKARKDLAYCRTYFENGDDARFKFLEALFARVESLP